MVRECGRLRGERSDKKGESYSCFRSDRVTEQKVHQFQGSQRDGGEELWRKFMVMHFSHEKKRSMGYEAV